MANAHQHREHSGQSLVDAARDALVAAGEQWTDMRAAVFAALAWFVNFRSGMIKQALASMADPPQTVSTTTALVPATGVAVSSVTAVSPPRMKPTTGGLARQALCVVVGISTGGPQALDQVLPLLRPPLPPLVVVQHMPGTFTGVFAKRLARICAVPVLEAEDGMRLVPDQILIAPGGKQLSLSGHPPLVKVVLKDDPPVSGHRPSVDVLFQSVAKSVGANAIGILLTGMGSDGAQGLLAMAQAGAHTIAQDEATSIVFGMPRAAISLGAAGVVAPIGQIARHAFSKAA